MAWLGSDWLYRQPLTIANHSGVAAPEAVLAVPAAFGKFWENVDPNFNDIRITTADGITLLNWAFDGTPSIANRTMTMVNRTQPNLHPSALFCTGEMTRPISQAEQTTQRTSQ